MFDIADDTADRCIDPEYVRVGKRAGFALGGLLYSVPYSSNAPRISIYTDRPVWELGGLCPFPQVRHAIKN